MTTSSLAEDLFAQLQGAPLQQVSQQLGIGQMQASSANGAALPLLLGALGRNAAQPQGAEALFGALQRNHNGLDLGSVLGAVLGGASSPQANGAGILGHVFGGQQNRAELGLGQATGLGGERAGQLLKILAPIVLAFLAQRMSQGSAQNTPLGLAEVLGQEQRQVQQQGGVGGGLLGAVLDQDGDGQLGLGDILKIGSGMFGGGR